MKNYVAGGMAYEWLAKACAQVGGIYNSRRHLEVNIEESDQGALRAWLSARVQEVEPTPGPRSASDSAFLATGRSGTTAGDARYEPALTVTRRG